MSLRLALGRDPRPLALAAVLALSWLAPSRALAQGAPPPLPPGLAPEEELDEKLRATPRAPDERTGHLFVRAHADLALPVGYATDEGSLEDAFAGGFTAGGTLGVGLTPSMELDALGKYGLLGASSDCDSCAGSMLVVGLGLRAHLVEGAALDPWVRYGVAYRGVTIERGEDEIAGVLEVIPGDYHGVDVAQITLGADFFPVRGLGFGPFLSVDLGTNVAWPDGVGEAAEARPYAYFSIGLDVTFDPVGVASPSASAAVTADAGRGWGGEPEGLGRRDQGPAGADAMLATQKETARAGGARADILPADAESADGR